MVSFDTTIPYGKTLVWLACARLAAAGAFVPTPTTAVACIDSTTAGCHISVLLTLHHLASLFLVLIKILRFPAVPHPDMRAVGAHASRVIVHSRLAPPKTGGYKFILLVPPLRQVLIRRIWQDCLQVEEGDLM